MRELFKGVPRATVAWVALGFIGYCILPWYLTGERSGGGLPWLPIAPFNSGLAVGLSGAPWLLSLAVPLLFALAALLPLSPFRSVASGLVVAGALGLALTVGQGFAIGLHGWSFDFLAARFGSPGPSQGGMGFGAALTATAFLMMICHGLAAWGWCRGDAFVVSSIGAIVALITIFVFFPVSTILLSAVQDNQGNIALGEFAAKLFDRVDLGIGLRLLGSALRGRLEHALPGIFGRHRDDRPRPCLCAHRNPHGLPVQDGPAHPERLADHHAAIRDRPCADPHVRPFGCRLRPPFRLARRAPVALDLWPAGRADRTAPRLHADRLPRSHRRGAGHQPLARRGVADVARQELGDLLDDHAPAHASGPRERLPARLRGKHGGFRQPAGARRQLRGALDQDLLCRRRRRAGSGPRGSPLARPPRLHARRVLAAACLAWQARLHDCDRQG